MKTIITMEIIIIKIFFLTKPLIYTHKKALYWFVTRKSLKIYIVIKAVNSTIFKDMQKQNQQDRFTHVQIKNQRF